MIEKEFVAKLISKLTELTVQKRITWVSLPKYFDANDNEPLRKAVISDNQYAYTPIEAQRIYLIKYAFFSPHCFQSPLFTITTFMVCTETAK